MRVFIASPGYSIAEKKLNLEIDSVIKGAGFSTFLLERDCPEYGLLVAELRKREYAPDQARDIASSVIGFLIYRQCYIECDVTVLNLNGRVPDEGSIIAAGISFASGKHLVTYCDDSRRLFYGIHHPLITVLTLSEMVNRIEEIPPALRRCFESDQTSRTRIGKMAADISVQYHFSDQHQPSLSEFLDLIERRFPRQE